MKKANFAIPLAEIKNGGRRLERRIPNEWLKERMSYCEYNVEPQSASADIQTELISNGVLIRGTVCANLKAACGTCLSDLDLEIRADINTFLMPESETIENDEEIEITPEELEREYFDGETVVLDELIGDAIMLEMPMNPKCADTCEILRSFDIANDADQIDPRLAPLMGIQINKEN